MNPQQARIYIANLFSHAFNRVKFLEFTRNLLNDNFDENKATVWPKKYIKDAFKPFVNHYERLGTYTAPDDDKLDVLIVHLTNDAQLERARTALRNFIADHLKQRNEKDAALVAFVSPSEQQWRFSYVKMEYSAIETAAGTVGIKTQLTPARRSSYLVGANESCHTAQSRFIGLLQEVRRTPTLTEIEEAFSVESVTKEFFKQYVQLFNQCEAALTELVANDAALAAEFTRAQINPVEFIKKLLGQLVFLYFLQKKGWLGVKQDGNWGSGARDFLRQLTNGAHGQYTNLFNDVLEPLLYDTLATDRGHAAWCAQFNCRLPFLNGGLFEPLGNYHWREVDVLLPNELFTNNERTAAGDIGTGIFDVFDRYNFTVNEAEPLEKDVAIDPEMLGKVFENLIEDNRRKGLGAYYTPREIVHYMCQESLINYLETQLNTPELTAVPRADLETLVRSGEQLLNYESVKTHYAGREMPAAIQRQAKLIDEALAAMTVCDPAVGSGAFPVGMMMEIVRVRLALMPYFNTAQPRSAYLFKRHAIQHCLYGVDIDPGAVEIAKLRLWLSLVVDEEEVEQIKPLPNLDYKIVVGNSLLGVSKDLFNEALFRQLEQLKPRYFDESDRDKKAQYRREIEAIIHQLTNGKAAFDFELYFSEVFQSKGGFDVVIGNPPYISAVAHAKTDESLRKTYRKEYPLVKGAFDIYTLFLLKGVIIGSKTSAFSWIIPNKVCVSIYSEAVINHLKQHGLQAVIDVSQHDVFENAAVYPIIFVGNKTSNSFAEYEIEKLEDLRYNRLIARKKMKEFKTFRDNHIKFASGTTGFQAQQLVPYIGDMPDEDRIPFVVSGSIDRYSIKFNNVRYMGKTYKKAFIKRYNKIAATKWEFWTREKIVIAGMTKVIEAVYWEAPLALGVGVYAIHDYGGFDPKFLLAVLNSKYLSYYMNIKFKDKHLAGGYMAINKTTLEALPFVIPKTAEQQQSIELLVDQILAAKSNNPKADTSALEREIDQLVYALYELTPDEIAIVEGAGK
ncbi:Eco57I restriction-modification methylase domain-containing protein [Thiospirillum jenense]|uniref:site-specific DNA-methyltransferase (adenine-specific) n=1 Tax=Thiospirillum jenense TaxID=1653858 RepID=A0A839HBG8_9GAMM|nr:TaqI-like C-terminal specificity domain-containing protein [Thiospirillum jenense]MBB1124658.1 Eco57I restriction-modification methylase domain-containing protein [Thiospirillum jenense]